MKDLENSHVSVDNTHIEDVTYINVSEMARLLSIAKVTAYQLTKLKGFPCFYIGKRIIIPLQAFNKWAEDQAAKQSILIER